jgi:putative ABC transport system substrate-binding protein
MQGVGMVGLGLVAGCGRLPWQSQPATTVHRIGYLSPQGLGVVAPRLEALERGLRALGWIEGQNLIIERRLAEGQVERLPDLAAELLQL